MADPLIARDLLFPEVLWKLPGNVHQRRGKVLLIGGFPGHLKVMLEIAEICSALQVRDISLVLPEGIASALPPIPEVEIVPAPETPTGSFSKDALSASLKAAEGSDVVLLGPELSKQPETLQFLKELTRVMPAPLLIAGDTLEAITGQDLIARKAPTVLVSDMGGFGRLLKQSAYVHESQANLMEHLYKEYQRVIPAVAQDWRVALTITTPEPVISSPDGRIAFVPQLPVDQLNQRTTALFGLCLALAVLHPAHLFECAVDALVILREVINTKPNADHRTFLRELPKVVTGLAS